ncbi:MAG: hypothetical protein WD733_17630 [Bryobacterales bacterium]
MKRRVFPIAVVIFAALSTALAAPLPQEAKQPEAGQNEPTQMIKGKWRATVAGKSYVLDLRVEDGDLLGTVTLPSRQVVEIEDGICVSEEFSFSTVEGNIEWEWNGVISEEGLEGERERFDTDATEDFTAKREP